MLKCPNCDATLDQDFGMVTCQECQSVLMIDLNGQVQINDGSEPQYTDGRGYSTAEEDDSTASSEVSITAPESFESVQTFDSDYSDDESEDDTDLDSENTDSLQEDFDPIDSDMDQMQADDLTSFDDDEDFEDPMDGGAESIEGGFEASVEDSTNEPIDDSFEESIDDSIEGSEDEVSDTGLVAADEEPEELETFPMPNGPDSNPVDITDYANSEVSNLEDGEFLYDITISRLDSKDLREALKYVLIDEKLKLNHHEYLKKIKDGKVLIEDLNPIKAKRIVEQLQYYSVTISWRQKRVVMEMVEPEVDEETGDVDEVPSEDVNV